LNIRLSDSAVFIAQEAVQSERVRIGSDDCSGRIDV
jgi:hypothetical protein